MLTRTMIHNQRQNPQVEEFVREHLQVSFEKFADKISRIEVHLLDENGQKGGGDDKICTIDVKLSGMGLLHVRAKNDDIYSSILKAIQRADASIAKTLDRKSSKTRIRKQGGLRRAAGAEIEANGGFSLEATVE